jgi:hypothetical protein
MQHYKHKTNWRPIVTGWPNVRGQIYSKSGNFFDNIKYIHLLSFFMTFICDYSVGENRYICQDFTGTLYLLKNTFS